MDHKWIIIWSTVLVYIDTENVNYVGGDTLRAGAAIPAPYWKMGWQTIVAPLKLGLCGTIQIRLLLLLLILLNTTPIFNVVNQLRSWNLIITAVMIHTCQDKTDIIALNPELQLETPPLSGRWRTYAATAMHISLWCHHHKTTNQWAGSDDCEDDRSSRSLTRYRFPCRHVTVFHHKIVSHSLPQLTQKTRTVIVHCHDCMGPKHPNGRIHQLLINE